MADFFIKTGKEINTSGINEIRRLLEWETYSDQAWRAVIEKSTFMVEVLHQGRTVGFARVVDDTEMCMIYDVIVHPDFQRKGIGRLLMTEILKYISENDFESVSLFYWLENEGLVSFYEKFGFHKIPNAMRLKK